MRLFLVCVGFLAAACSGCAAPPPVSDYQKFYSESPFTVVVPPVRNLTVDAEAPRYFISTVTKPLVDRGYYVIPVELTSEILAAEGIQDGGALINVPPSRYRKYFGADAVLLITLQSWDTTYLVFASSVTVAMEYKLVSTASEEILWEAAFSETITSDSGSGSGGHPLADLIVAAISAAATAAGTDYVPLARKANLRAFSTLPSGPYNPNFESEKAFYLGQP
ncbi:MAG: GNA1162 family protein [Planctomycetota bacterium]|jgi:hypothetical protein